MEKQFDGQLPLHEQPVEILKNLIRFDTTNPPGNEAECMKYIEELLSRGGFNVEMLSQDARRPNLVTRLPGRGNARPLLLYGHLDVVTAAKLDWQYPPFEGASAEGFIWGRGALDMKGGVAMMLAALLRARAINLEPEGDIIFAALSDEEAGGGLGAKFLVENYSEHFSQVKYAIGEFGGFTMHVGNQKFYPIMVAEKQACWMKAVLKGPAGHGSIPLRGGAMAKLGRMIERLDRKRLPVHVTPVVRRMIETMTRSMGFPKGIILGMLLKPKLTDFVLNLLGDNIKHFDPLLHNTVNATMVKGGEKINVVPSEITVQFDGRLLPGFKPEDMFKELKDVVGPDIDFEIELYDAFHSHPDLELFDTLASVIREFDPDGIPLPMLLPGITDGRHFAKLGIQTYGFLPMKLPSDFNFTQSIHAADERIPEEAVNFGAEAIFKLFERYS